MCLQAENEHLRELRRFMEQELREMAQSVSCQYRENMRRREENPFLPFQDSEIKKYMALGRSVDSQLGNRVQRIIFFLARMRHGQAAVPNIVELILDEEHQSLGCVLDSVPCDLPPAERNKGFAPYRQEISVSRVLRDEDTVKRRLKLRKSSGCLDRRCVRIENTSTDQIEAVKKKLGKRIPVDLLTLDIREDALQGAETYEIKMGGQLDTKNAESNAKEVGMLRSLFQFLPHNGSYFATCYGQCSAAVETAVSQTVGRDGLLEGRAFWDKVLPADIPYGDFITAFQTAFSASGLERTLAEL